jgi:hypothetical protein
MTRISEDKIRLATKCNKNGHRQNAKNNAELWIKWTKTTWKAFEDTVRRGRNMFFKAYFVTDDDDDNDDI